MLIATKARKETSTGLLGDTKYEIENGPHMMQILSGLYKNPAVAMVREYLTNMYDAHIALYKATGDWGPLPVLTLPTSLNPILIFEDNGIGMSAETVRTVYTRYGRSTKSDSNDEVGGFGLGAKVAFTYNGGVDWTIASRFDGELHQFVARVGKENMPVLSHLGSEATDRHNGTTVTIPIQRHDVNEIHQAAKELLPHFPIPIKLVNADMPVVEPPVLEFGDYKVYGNRGYREGGITLVIGNVPYHVDDNVISNITRDDVNLDAAGYFFSQNKIVIVTPVGSVDIVPSRDNVKNTDRTKATIKALLTDFMGKLPAQMNHIVDGAKTEYEARALFNEYNKISYIEKVLTFVTYKGIKIKRGEGIVRKITSFPNTEISTYAITKTSSASITEVELKDDVMFRSNDTGYIMVNDINKGFIRIAKGILFKHFVAKTHTGRAQRNYGHTVSNIVVMVTNLTPAQISKKAGGFPVDRILKASDYKTIKGPKGGISVENIYKFTGTSWSARVNVPKADGSKRYYLVLTQAHDGARFSYNGDHDDVRRLQDYASEIGMESGREVFGVRTGEEAKLAGTDWVEFNVGIKDYIAEMMSTKAEQMAAWKLLYNEHDGHSRISRNLEYLKAIKKPPADLTALIADIKLVMALQKDVDQLCRIMNRLGSPLLEGVKQRTTTNPITSYDKFMDKHPMLKILLENGTNRYHRHNTPDGEEAKVISEYLNRS